MGRPKKVDIPVTGVTVDELKVGGTATETLPPELEKVVTPTTDDEKPSESAGVSTKETIQVDKYLFYKMFKTCVSGQGYTKTTAVVKFGAMLGAKTFEEQKAEWNKAQDYLKEHN